jgi:protease IV
MDQSPPPVGLPEPPLRPEVVLEPLRPQAPPRQKSRVLGRLFLVFLLLGLLGSGALNLLLLAVVGLAGLGSADEDGRLQEKFYVQNRPEREQNRFGRNKVAILSVEGTILSGEGFFKQQIDHARKDIEDGTLKAIVLRVNSPGGTITGSDYMLRSLRKLLNDNERKHIPIVVSMGGLAASGGYYVSMCVGDTPDTIFAEPSTWTGSIGVLIPHYNVAELMQKWGIQQDDVTSHRLKDMGSMSRKMTPEERQIFQALVDDGFTQFKKVVMDGRPNFRLNPAALDKIATGQVFTADQALKNGLVDRIGFIEDAIDQAIRLAGLNRADVKVVKYKSEPRLSDILFGQSQAKPSFDLAALLDATTPRGYYLCTWLPALAANAK